MATSLVEQIQEIREMVKSNPELVRRLDLVELQVDETQNQTEAWCSSIMENEDKLIHENEGLKMALVDQDTEFCKWKDDNFGDIHALQVQNSILKAELQQIELDKNA